MPLSKSILVSLILDKDAVSKWSNLFDRIHVNLHAYNNDTIYMIPMLGKTNHFLIMATHEFIFRSTYVCKA